MAVWLTKQLFIGSLPGFKGLNLTSPFKTDASLYTPVYLSPFLCLSTHCRLKKRCKIRFFLWFLHQGCCFIPGSTGEEQQVCVFMDDDVKWQFLGMLKKRRPCGFFFSFYIKEPKKGRPGSKILSSCLLNQSQAIVLKVFPNLVCQSEEISSLILKPPVQRRDV